jgi:hypothetical protein
MKKFNDPVEGFFRKVFTAEFWGPRGGGIWIAGAAGVLLAKYFLT